MAGNVQAGFSLKQRGGSEVNTWPRYVRGSGSSITTSLLKIVYSWLHLSPEWYSGAFPGSTRQAHKDLLAGTNTVITGKTSREGSAEYTLCCCGTYLLPWGHRDPPDTVGIGGVAIWKARGWEITCWVLQGLSTSCRRGEKNLSKRSDSERHQGLPNCLLMAAVCRLVAGTPTVLIHGTGQRSLTTWDPAKGVMWNLSEFLG